MDAFLAKKDASDQRFFNPGSDHVKIPMKKEHFFGTFIMILRRFFPVFCGGYCQSSTFYLRAIPLRNGEGTGGEAFFVCKEVGFPPLENQCFSAFQIQKEPCCQSLVPLKNIDFHYGDSHFF